MLDTRSFVDVHIAILCQSSPLRLLSSSMQVSRGEFGSKMETRVPRVCPSNSKVIVCSSASPSQHHQPHPHRMDDRLAAALDTQLAEDGVDVELDGVLADGEALGDLLVGEALGEELEHFALARGQGLGQLFGR